MFISDQKDWWRCKEADMASELSRSFASVKEAESLRVSMDVQNLRLYGNHANIDFNPSVNDYRHQERLTYNLCKAVTDTIVSQVARHRVSARFLTSGGSHKLRKRAKNMERFVEAEMYRLGMRLLAPRHALDAVVFGSGFLHPYIKHGKIHLDRVMPAELFCDPAESLYGSPQALYRRRWVNKDRLVAAFPKAKGAILASGAPGDEYGPGLYNVHQGPHRGNLIEVIEAWHLRSGPKEKDGAHAICIENALLLHEPWEFDEFPFIGLRYGERLTGWWGVGAVESVTPIQVELNRTLIKLQKIYHLVAVPRVFVNAGAGLKKNQINNDIGAVYTYKGEPPIFAPPTQAGGEIFNYIQTLIDRGFSQEGVSPFLASGQKPSGLTAGVAIREANEIQMGKLALFMNSWDDAHIQLATWLVRLGKELSKRPGGFKFVAARDKYSIDQLDWKDVDIDESDYVIRVYPTSALPNEPSGRLSTVADMLQMGLVTPDVAKRLINFPDIEEDEELDRAETDAIDMHIGMMLDEGAGVVPEPFQDPRLALKRAQAAYNRAVARGVPEERLSLIRTYMAAANHNLEQEQAAQAQMHAAQSMPGAGSPPATGIGGAPPTAAPGPGML